MLHYLPEFAQYLALKHLSPSTITSMKRDITQLEAHLFPLKLHYLEQAHLEAALLSLKHARNLAPVTLNRKSSSLRTFFAFLRKRGHLNNNPASPLPSARQI